MRHPFRLSIIFLFAFNTLLFSQQEWIVNQHENQYNFFPNDKSEAVAIDENGAVYTTGTSFNYDANTGQTNGKTPLKKISPAGHKLYVRHHNIYNLNSSNLDEKPNDIAVSLANNRVAIGGWKTQFRYPFLAFFKADDGSFVQEASFNWTSGEITKMDVLGNELYVIGNFAGTITFDNSYSYTGDPGYLNNVFIAKYNIVTGNLMTASFLKGTKILAYDIKVDPYSNIYFTLKTDNLVQFIGGLGGVYIPQTIGQTEVIVCKLNATHQKQWAARIGAVNIVDYCKYPIDFSMGEANAKYPTLVVGASDNTGLNAFIQTRDAITGNLVVQSPLYNNKIIKDLTLRSCAPKPILVVGNEILSNATPGYGFLFEFGLFNYNNGYYYYSSNPAEINAVETDATGNPIIAGTTPSSMPNFQFRGQSVAQNGDSHEFVGKFQDNSSCCQNRGLILDGVNDYLEGFVNPLDNNIYSTATFTFEAWVYSTATNTGSCTGQMRRLMACSLPLGNSIEMGECSGNLVVNYYKKPVIGTGLTYNIVTGSSLRNGWHHVALTLGSGGVNAYVDGLPVTNPVITTQLGNVPVPKMFYIGRGLGTPNTTETWKGRIDEVRIWNYARTQSDIQNKKNCKTTGSESGLLVYYAMNSGSPSGNNTGATNEWNYSKVWANTPYFSYLRNFALTGSLSNWTCSTVTINTNCFAEGSEDREAITEEANPASEMLQTEVQIYPNPNNGVFNLKLAETELLDLHWRVISLTGAVLSEQPIVNSGEVQQLNMPGIPSGLYFLQIFSGDTIVSTKKFVVDSSRN